jgi:MFS transporter, MHS family, proline/betaine transporter
MNHRKILLASILGNTLEYYEFTIFATFAVQIGKAFFINQSEFIQTVLTLGLFAVGFVSRPFGSLIFGHIGDKLGRKKALLITIIGMSFTTFGIGCMPTCYKIGVIAPISLLLLRLLQGIFIGGEGAGSAVYVLEHKFKLKRDIIAGILISSNFAGVVIASAVGVIINKTIGLDSNSWRIAFIIGGVAGLLVSYMRVKLPETVEYAEILPEDKPEIPAVRLFSKYWPQVLIVIAFGAFSSGVSYVIKGYLVIHFQNSMDFSTDKAFMYLMFTSVLLAIFPPFLAYFSNKHTYRKFIYATTVAIICAFVPIMMLISTHNTFYILCGLALIALLAAAICTPVYIYFSDMFPTEVRYSGVAVSHNLGIVIAGFTPIVSVYLVEITSFKFAPALYIISLAVLYLVLDVILHKKIKAHKAKFA